MATFSMTRMMTNERIKNAPNFNFDFQYCNFTVNQGWYCNFTHAVHALLFSILQLIPYVTLITLRFFNVAFSVFPLAYVATNQMPYKERKARETSQFDSAVPTVVVPVSSAGGVVLSPLCVALVFDVAFSVFPPVHVHKSNSLQRKREREIDASASFRSGTFEVKRFLKFYQLAMGKSPGKWIKAVLFGKKSSKSNLSKDSTLDKKTSITINSHSKDLGADSMVISSPVRHIINVNGEQTQLEKRCSANLMHDTAENLRNTVGFNAANDDELIRLEQAATKAQAAFRGYLARQAFWALKGIIRLQALARGHLVRRQAVATLACMRAIVEFQALVRGQKVRLSRNGPQILQKRTPGDPVHKERANLLQTSLKSEKLSKNAFGVKLVTSSKTIMPLNIQYDPDEPNSVKNWLERWSSSHFWDPLPQPKKTLNIKPKRKQTKSQSQETETTKPKRTIRKVPAPSLNNYSNLAENEKTKRTARKISTPQPESVQDKSHSELEKVKHSLRKISVSAAGGSEMSTIEKVNELNVMVAEPLPAPPLEDKSLDANGKGVSKTNKPQIFLRDEKVISAGWRR
ncbi:hypothetical protein L1987_43918 [Smallanthus sonchifolius]|uniref:Uncharacterized protein n=1 Tax=Smallanthus sonchifolius TaxID=185202 RepID=A0ACB9GNR0_9ASTR|nr:hypothetical protein L1987_43918 [Smallanthus sonchifolius]